MIRRRLLAVTTTLAVIPLALSACSSQKSSGSDDPGSATIPLLRVAAPVPEKTLDPAKTLGGGSLNVGFLERLFTFNADHELEPQLATKMTNPDPTTYEYQLREGVKFWDGTEMTSEDVVHSLKYQADPQFGTASFYASMKSIEAVDRYRVRITLNEPDASWQYLLAWQGSIFEKKFQQENKETFGDPGTLVMGTGPWKVDSFDPTKSLELSANPDWWGGEVPVKKISQQFFENDTSAALAFRADQVDVVFPGDARVFESTSGSKVEVSDSCQQGFLSLNANIGPWKDPHVRRAVAYALNKQDIITAAGGYRSESNYFIPPDQLRILGSQSDVDAVLDDVPQYEYDLDKAKAEMAQSAYPDGFSATTEATSSAFGDFVTTSQAIAGQLEKIGIDLEVKKLPLEEWFSTVLYGPKVHGIVFTTIACPTPDPGWYPGYLLGSKAATNEGANMADYKSPEIDALITKGITATDSSDRLATYGELMNQVATDLPYIPLYQNQLYLGLASKYSWPTWATGPYYQSTQWPLSIEVNQ